MAQAAEAVKTSYQGQMHLLQKEMMGRYFERVTRAAEKGEGKAVYMLISGNPVELIQAFDLIPVYPEIDALQLAVKKSALPFILKAEELGYSMDNCAYVKADVGLFLGDRKTPFATIPLPSLILCNYVGCNVYLQWFEHLAEYCDGQLYNLDIPFLRDPSGVPSEEDLAYVVRQLEEVIEICEKLTGKKLDYARLKEIVGRSSETGEMWSRIKGLTKNIPSPFDAYFDSVTMMAPLYCLRGTEDGVRFFETALKEMEEKVRMGTGPLPEERFRFVIEGPPPWPYLRTFRDLFLQMGRGGSGFDLFYGRRFVGIRLSPRSQSSARIDCPAHAPVERHQPQLPAALPADPPLCGRMACRRSGDSFR